MSSCVSRELALVQIGKRPNHLGFDMKESKKKVFSRKTEGACSSTFGLPLSVLQPGGMPGSWEDTFAARLQKLLLGVMRELWPGIAGGEQTLPKWFRK